jgi:hypothetical protein
MLADKSYGVDIQGSGAKVLRMGIDKPKPDRKDSAAPWCIQFWIKFRDAKKNKGPHAQFCIFVSPGQLRSGLQNTEYRGHGEQGGNRRVSIRGVGTPTISVEGVYESGNTGASTEVAGDSLKNCLEDLFRRLDAD